MEAWSEALIYERHEHLAFLTLNDPQTRNALTGDPVFSAFEKAVDRMNADMSVRCAILTGAGTAFCSGGNLADMRARKGMFGGAPHEIAANYRAGIQRIPRALSRLEVPLIAAVNGPAIGAGCDLACMCDIRLASTRATFAESFVKVGIVAGDGGTWLLSRMIGYSRAAEMAFTGDSLDAEAALEVGLVSRIVAPEDLLAEARKLALRISANPPHVVRWTKRLLRAGNHQGLDETLDLAAAYQALAHHTLDHAEAMAAQAERRSPRFEAR